MKKKFSILAVLLVIVMCLSMVLAGCSPAAKDDDGAKEKKPKTPEAQLTSSMEKTMSAMLGSEAGLGSIGGALKEQSKITIEVEDQFENVLYLDLKNSYIADFLSFETYDGEQELSVFLKDTALALAYPAILGDDAYGVDFDTLETDLKNSDIWDAMGVSYEEVVSDPGMDVGDMTNTLVDVLDSLGKLEDVMEEAAKDIKVDATKGKATIDGEEVEATVITVHMTSNDVKKILIAYVDWAEGYLDRVDEDMGETDVDLDSALDDYRTEIEESFSEVDLTLDATVYIDPTTEYMMSCTAELAGTMNGSEGSATMDLVLGKDPATSKKYTFDMTVTSEEDDENKLSAVLSRDLDQDVQVSELNVTVTEADGDERTFGAKLEYDTKNYDYEVTVDDDGTEYSAEGKFQLTEDVIEFSVDEYNDGYWQQSVGLRIRIEAIGQKDMPEMPAFTNILKLSEDELQELFGDIGY